MMAKILKLNFSGILYLSADGIKNNCEAAWALVKCLHQKNPKYFFA